MIGPGRMRQNDIYTAGIHRRKPRVPTDFAELERRARRAMSERAWAYVGGGAGEGRTMAANRSALDRWAIVPRVLRDVSQRSLEVELFGQRLPAPILFAPVGAGSLVMSDADIHIGHAAAELGVPYIFSNQGSASMERVAREMEGVTPGAPRWFQLYWSVDDDLVDSLLVRAEKMGAAAIVVTLDTTMLGWRPQDLNLGSLPFARGEGIAQYTSDRRFTEIVAERAAAAGDSEKPEVSLGVIATLFSIARNTPGKLLRNLMAAEPRVGVQTFLDIYSRPSLNWTDVEGLRARTSLPILLKGVLHPDDARRAVDAGVDGIVVSNHGGRQIDGSISSIDALDAIAPVVDGRIKVLIDSGIYTGADVFKALALGADAACIGRPHMYGLALAGADGARDAVANIIAELDLTLGLAGYTRVADVDRDALQRM
ncbi:Lactate 2-monooxygenase [Gordonia bronchialis DSM 43247]|uniref:Lactate 2-monooxygenase n=1 Tax=Gordonia bronchialis (strain ATCC 25592 / DSM 43247 / BCRC 13721 / JCM 3198 / KCTC 3076 / NBRC 16047 / NCTC 10667) TaxID=526226 RepID=D0L6U6_GORB4|nr:alpha-hydroxy-acid oxidizing protein [Gordonia bronchialis]ACY23656.1 Lactate 2-monooxygenase [Gordonia bronchialis DSM 43247]MCC3321823.1 alpha-hydroxy-acid oxidizing protein [Gordonia bronchialis]QGS23012.1 lactate 2-monooxygenase [Gordonia bronchialis]STQ66666.1 Lactate 2-monooxygenase [Gordonia bronchialis]